MQEITLNIPESYALQMQKLMKVLGDNLFIDTLFDYHVKRLKREIVTMQNELNKFEEKYKISSAEFYEKLENGEFGDEQDFVQWSGIYELQLDSKEQLAQLI